MNKNLPLLLLGFLLLFFQKANTQTICPDPITVASNDALPGCTICDFPITGSSAGYSPGPFVNGNYPGCNYRVSVDNDQYIVFIANQPCVNFNIDAWNCTRPNNSRGLQGFIADLALSQIYICDDGCGNNPNPAPFNVGTCGLTIGQAYVLIIDGCLGSECDFTVNATGTQGGNFASITPDPVGPFCDTDPITTLTGSPVPTNPGDIGIWSGDVTANGEIDPAALGSGNFSATYSFTNQWGCMDDATVSWTINPTPVVTIDPAGPYCDNDLPVTLNFSPPGGIWSGPISSSGVFDPAGAGVGSHSINYLVDIAGCSDDSTIIIDVLPAPMVTVDPILDLCENEPIYNATASPAGGSWSGDINPNGSIDPSVLGSGSFSGEYLFVASNGCRDSMPINFNINPSPTVTLTAAGPFCDNDNPVNLSGSPSGGVWSPNAPGGSFNPMTLGPGSYNVTYEYTDPSTGCMDIDDIDIIVNAAPTVTITQVGPFCENDPSVVVQATPPGGTWSGPIAPDGTFDPSTAGSGPHTVTYTFTNADNCTDDESIIIQVDPTPTVVIDPIPDLCSADLPTNATASPPGGIWSGDVGPNGEIDASLGIGTFTAIYNFTDALGCDGSDMQTFIINLSPVVTLDDAGPFCENDLPVTLTFSPPGGTWTGANNGVFDPMAAGPGSHIVTYEFTDPTTGCDNSAMITINVNQAPMPMINDPGPLCVSEGPTQLTASPSGGVWGPVANNAGEIDPSSLGVGNHTVTYSFTNSLGCTEDTDLTIVVVPLPIVTAGPQPPVCENDGFTTISGTPGGGIWTGDVDAGGGFDPEILGPGTYNATYTYTDGNGCMGTDMTTFVINPAPMVTISPVSPQCEGGAPTTVVGMPAGGTWTGPISPTGVFDPAVAGPGTHTITYSVTNSFGCTEEEMIDIDVVAEPIIDFLSPDTYCASDDPIILDASPFGGIWGGDADVNGQIIPANLGPGSFTVTYSYTDPVAGCTAVLTQQITILPGASLSFSNTGPFCFDDGRQFITVTPDGGNWGGVAFFGGEIIPSLTGIGVHDVTYDYTDANGCFVDTIFQIEILEAPFVEIDPINDLCPYDSPVQMTASPSGGNWGGAVNSSGVFDPIAIGFGSHIVTYTIIGANGCTAVAEFTVEVNEEFDIFFFDLGPFCLENQIHALDADPFGGSWSGAVDFNGEFNPINLGSGIHTAYYEYFYGTNCVQNDSVQFEVLPADDVVFGDSIFCQNTGNQTLTATPTGGAWSGPNTTPSGEINTDNLPIGSFTVTYTVTQAGGACDISDAIEIEIQGITADITGDTIFCQTAGIQTLTATPTGGVWGGVADATGNIDPSALSVGSHTVSYTATSATGCMTTVNQIINVTAPPTAVISGMGTICPGGNASADLTITLTGAAPWTVAYDLGGTAQVPISVPASPFLLSATQAGTYTLTGVTDNSGCTDTATGTATVTELMPLSVSGIMSQCNATNTGFTVSFEISGGDSLTYSVSGLTGTISTSSPFTFASQNIPTGTPVNFTVSDNSGCAPVMETLTVDCSCETEVGTMNSTPIDICGMGTATAIYDNTGEFLDADDLVQFVLHTNAGISLGTVLETDNAPSFGFNSTTMIFGTTYYISAIAGSNDGNGNVDLTDNCLKVAQGTPVTWRENPTAILTGGTAICEDSTATMQITLTGQSPWFIRYWNGTDTLDLNGITSSPFDLNVTPTATTTYELVEVSNNFCPGTASGTEVVTVNESPTISIPTTQCDATATNYTVSFDISGGDPTTYSVSGLTGNIVGNTFTSDPIPSGTSYSVSVSDGNGCPPAIFSDLIDCGCLTTVGTMDGAALRICGDGSATAIYDDTNQFLDADDIVAWYLHTNSDNTIGMVIATNTTPEFSFDASQMMYGTTYYISAAAGSNTGNGTIDLGDNCTDISIGTPVVFQIAPTAMLGSDMTICEGTDTTLTITLTGAAPWAIVYNDGTNDRNLTVPSSPFTIDISPTQNTTYTLVSVRDGNCPGTISGTAEVTIVSPPSIDNLITECNIDKTEYTVSFDIIGGDPTTYDVTGNAGTLVGGTFTSAPIPAGDGYSFTVSDGNGCGQVDVSAADVRCDCETDAGSIQITPLEACVNQTVEIVTNGDEFLDVNDTLMFALHDGSANFLGNVITLNSGTTFSFDASQMTAGTRYFISAVAGNRDLATGINLGEPCLSVSTGVAVVFNALPTVLITSDQDICEGDEVTLTLQMTGQAPFTVTLSNGDILTDIMTGFEYKITPSDDITISIASISDANGCDNTSVSEAIITVNTPPEATLNDADICNTTQNNNVSTLDLGSLITAGDATGTWREIGNPSGAAGTLPVLDFDGVAAGQYRFEYTTGTAILPCVDKIYEVTITVTDCSCPSVATAPASPFCADDAELDLATITTTSEAGSWAITNAPMGSTATITGNIFRASGSADGDYELTFTLDQTPDPGCPESSMQTIQLIAPPTATVTPVAQICNTNQSGEPTAFDFSTLITDGDTGGTWLNVDGVTAAGTLPNLDFDGITPGNYTFRYTTASAQTPCNEQTYDVILTVRDCACPSVVTALAGPFCTDDAELDLTTITTTTEPGSWAITNAPTGSTAEIAGSMFRASGSVDGDYELTFTLNAPVAGCPENSIQTITLFAPPSAIVTTGAEVCNSNLNGDLTTFDFSTLVTGGDTGGTWLDVDGVIPGASFPILDFDGVTPGDYNFRYTTASAQSPCSEAVYDMILTIRDCSCPSVTTAPAGPFCNDAAMLDLTTITVTSEPGNWTISNAPTGSTATIVGNTFDATNSAAGDYELTFTLSQTPPAGCDNSSSQTIQVAQFVSAGTGTGTLRICNDGTELDLNAELTGATPGGVWSDISATAAGSLFNNGILTTQNLPKGTYIFQYEVTTTAPCAGDTETITVEIDDPVNAGNLIQNLSLCEGLDTMINLFDLIENYDLGGVWTDISATAAPSFNASGTVSTVGLPNGIYRFQYSLTTNGICTPDDETVEIRMSESPVADAGETFELTCDIRTATLGGARTSTGQNINYQWSGSTTIEDPTAATTTTREAAVYTIRVTDSQSGCFAEDQVIITEQGSLPTLDPNPADITCFGDNDGEITINGVTGGVPPYLYSLNGSPFSSDSIFRNLTPGIYTLVVEDALGCQDEATLTIEEPDELSVRLTTDLGANSNLIQQGDSVQLNANLTGTFDSIQWSPPEAFEPCDPEVDPLGCIMPWVSPNRVTTYEVFVVDENGCNDRSSITINVEKVRNVYIPSAFSPNDDGINDAFQIFTDANVEKIQTFLVFDRWGNLIFEYSDFAPDDPAGRWDGRFRGKRMNSAVFAYFAKVEFTDGTSELYEGDVSLLR